MYANYVLFDPQEDRVVTQEVFTHLSEKPGGEKVVTAGVNSLAEGEPVKPETELN